MIRVGCSNVLRLNLPRMVRPIAEFGTVTDPDGFKGLYAMDVRAFTL